MSLADLWVTIWLKVAETIFTDHAKKKIKKLEEKSNDKNKEDIKDKISELALFQAESKINLRDDIAPNLLSNHLDYIKQWSSEISFSDLQGVKKLSNTYIDLKTYIMPQRLHSNSRCYSLNIE